MQLPIAMESNMQWREVQTHFRKILWLIFSEYFREEKKED